MFVFRLLSIPRCLCVGEGYLICFTVKCGDAVFIPVNPPIFVEVLYVVSVIRNVDIVFVTADKADGIYKSPCLKSKGGIRSAGFGMKSYLSFLGKGTAGICIPNKLSQREHLSCIIFMLGKQAVHIIFIGK